MTLDGNTALSYGLIAAGVRYGAGYPITPWTSVMEILRTELSKYGGPVCPDGGRVGRRILYALGFSYAGHLAVTGSSGPGLSLKMEALGWGTMAEMPLIVINVQRGGPSTGMPTNVEQSDLPPGALRQPWRFPPRVVLAPRNVEECFYAALEAARIARKYSTPVIILSDQGLATRIEAFDEPDLPKLMKDPKPDLSERAPNSSPSPRPDHAARPSGFARSPPGKYPTVSGLEHDELGHPTGNARMHQRMKDKRREKLKG